MIGKPIAEIEEEHLQSLVDSKVAERKTLEYKRTLPGDSKHDKKEFLADVSSFANASGGDIVYGMTAQAGVPTSLDGLSSSDIDGAILRLESMVRDGIRPRIPSIQTQPITLSNTNVAIVLRVPKSWASPHRVIYEGHDKFYSRSSNGKYPLDVDELRSAFIASETLSERIRDFRADRIAKIVANETPVPLLDSPKIVLHLIPLTAFNPGQTHPIEQVASSPPSMPPIRSMGWNHRYNLDGFLTFSDNPDGICRAYTQLFRNGIIEAVDAYILRSQGERPTIRSITFEEKLIEALSSYLTILKVLNIEPPAFLFLTLIGVKGFAMGLNTWKYDIDEIHTIDRDILVLPEIVIDDYNIEADKALRPCFDSVWNACGFSGSLYYDEEGKWAP